MITTQLTSQDTIAEVVSTHLKISTFDMFKKCRRMKNINARYVFIFLSRKFTNDSLHDIADYISKKGFRTDGYDHASVLHGFQKMSGYVDTYIESKELIRTLSFVINQNQAKNIVVSDVDLLISAKLQTNI